MLLIQTTIDPSQSRWGGQPPWDNTLQYWNGRLLVTRSAAVHERINKLLAMLRSLRD